MKYDPQVYHRRSIRLRGYDYSSPGVYYVTLCSFNKGCIWGRVVAGQMQENECGAIVRAQWFESARMRQEIELDAFVVMPNHVHGIVRILGPQREPMPSVGASGARPTPRDERRSPLRGGRQDAARPRDQIPPMRPRSLASWAAGFKAAVTSGIRRFWGQSDAAIWQRDYYEHVIRDEEELNRIREYILTNPLRWGSDRYNPECTAPPEEDETGFDW